MVIVASVVVVVAGVVVGVFVAVFQLPQQYVHVVALHQLPVHKSDVV